MPRPARPRVVFLDHVARLSGGEIALLRLLPAIAADVEAVVVLGEDGPLVEPLRATGARVEVLPLDPGVRDTRRDQAVSLDIGRLDPRPALRLAAYVWRLSRRIRALDAELVHTNSLKSALYGGVAGRLAGVPVVWHVRDRIADDYLPPAAVRLVRRAARILPAGVIANSAATLATLPDVRRGSVLYNPVVPDTVPQELSAPREPEHPFRVGVVGRLAEWKGQHVFLEAFAQAFAGTTAEAWLIGSALFGEDDYERRLHDLAARLGIESQVRWRGFRGDVAAELARIDVLVHCSTTPEPFGQVVVEGMAAGVPVVASAEGGPLEIVQDGADGLLVPPRDPALLAAALTRLHRDPAERTRLGLAARESSRRFSPEYTAERLLAVYSAVLGRELTPVRR